MIRHVLVYLLVFACVSCILRKPKSDRKFISLQQQRGVRPNTMIDKVHEQHWNISYNYGDDCPAEQQDNDDALTAATTEVMQMWLQPLREYTKKPIVADFRYHLGAERDASDLTVVFHCDDRHVSTADTSRVRPPQVDMRKGTKVTRNFTATFLHEMGHAFGLADTYVRVADWGNPQLDKGGLDSTKGTQPAALMSGNSIHKDGRPVLGQDDKNGVIWLYEVVHEGLSIRDCFFSDYELEHAPLGCRPKHPLIFELKHGIEVRVLRMLKQDENLDVNARDADGMTALHYAVLYGYKRVVEELIKHDNIKPYVGNKKGQSPMQLAKELKRDDLAQLIAAHPKALPVDAKGKKITTWGEIKRGDN